MVIRKCRRQLKIVNRWIISPSWTRTWTKITLWSSTKHSTPFKLAKMLTTIHRHPIMERLKVSHRVKLTTWASSEPVLTITTASTKHLLKWLSRREATPQLQDQMMITRPASTPPWEIMPRRKIATLTTTKSIELPSSSSTRRCREALSCLTMSRTRSTTRVSDIQCRSTRPCKWAKSCLKKRSETLLIQRSVDASWLFKMRQQIMRRIASKSHSPRADKDSSNKWRTRSSRQVLSKKRTITTSQSSLRPSPNSNRSKRKTSTNTSKNWTTRSSRASPSPSRKRECEWTPPTAISRRGRCLKW
jgi:hypothetical protein